MLDATPPERFSVKFLENLGFTSTNDRLFIGILKDLGFLNRDGTPQPRYFQFLDRARAKQAVAEGIRDAFADLFAVNTKAQDLPLEEVKNRLRTMYAGKKSNLVIDRIATTFKALSEYGDFSATAPSAPAPSVPATTTQPPVVVPPTPPLPADVRVEDTLGPKHENASESLARLRISALEYHINIVLPDTRDQAVYDAIFKSFREHLG